MPLMTDELVLTQEEADAMEHILIAANLNLSPSPAVPIPQRLHDLGLLDKGPIAESSRLTPKGKAWIRANLPWHRVE